MSTNFMAEAPDNTATSSLADQAHEALTRMIRERELRAGEPLVEQQIAKYLGISRTPIREAMQRLELEGFLRKSSSRSLEVRRVELREYLHSLRVREVLESEAAAWAVDRVLIDSIETARASILALKQGDSYDCIAHRRSDDQVHRLIIDHCGNEVMREMLISLRVITELFELERLADRLDPDTLEHQAILDALAARNAKAARRSTARHIRSLYAFAVQVIG